MVSRQGSQFCFPLKHVVRNVILQMEASRDGIKFAKKFAILDHSYVALCDNLDCLYEHSNNQLGL